MDVFELQESVKEIKEQIKALQASVANLHVGVKNLCLENARLRKIIKGIQTGRENGSR